MTDFRFGIIGNGLIAEVITNTIKHMPGITVSAIASRRSDKAQAFAQQHAIPHVFNHWQELLGSDEIDAVYLACPTAFRESMAIEAALQRKHILAEKPFANCSALQNMLQAAMAHGVALMDATHFTHHARTRHILENKQNYIGNVQAIRSAFFFPMDDNDNIRFDLNKEPMGLIGDMAWYNMRAIIEFMQPQTALKKITGSVQKNAHGALVRGSGLLIFDDGRTANIDFGYNAGVCLMDLDLIGEHGALQMNDFVLDWKNSFAFDNPEHQTGYFYRQAMQTPKDFTFVKVSDTTPQVELLIRNFVAFAKNYNTEQQKHYNTLALQTQALVDSYWQEVCV